MAKNVTDDKLQAALQIDQICDAFEETILAGKDPSIVDYIADVNDSIRETLFEQLLKIQVELNPDDSQQKFNRYLREFPQFLPVIQRVQAMSIDEGNAKLHHAMSFANAIGGNDTVERPETKKTSAGSPPVGKIGEYELLEKIGEGGMGAVYKARHCKLDKIVAIKVLPAERMKDPQAVARFEREMRAVGKLEHPNIVRAMDAGVVNGVHFLVMEYVHGIDLSRLVNHLGPLPIADACELVRQAAVGLDEADDHDMVHRDIKPSNLILAFPRRKRQPIVKILDMGLALLSDAHLPGSTELTHTGQLMGTLDYMAPEQGGNTHSVDIRADIYSLGATLYHLLTRKVIYDGEDFSTPVQKIVGLATIPAPPVHDRRLEVPSDLSQIVHKMLAKSPESRFQTPDEVADALIPFSKGCDLNALVEQVNRIASEESPANEKVNVAAEDARETTTDKNREAETGGVTNPAGIQATIDTAMRPPITASSSRPPLSVKPSVAKTETQSTPNKRFAIPWRLIIGGLAMLLLMGLLSAATVLFLQTPDGTLQVEINDPSIEVKVKGTNIVFTQKATEPIKIAAGGKSFVVTRDDFSFETRQFILKKGETTVVKVDLLPGKLQVVAAGDVIGTKALTPSNAKTPIIPTGGSPIEDDSGGDLAAIALSFSLNGHVSVTKDGKQQTINSDDPLPDPPYDLTFVFPGGNASDEDLKVFASASSLVSLDLKGSPVTDRGIEELRGSKKITYLQLRDIPLSDDSLVAIGSLTSLQSLDFFSGPNPISGEGLAKLSQLPKLRELRLQTKFIDESHLKAIGACESLESLNLMVSEKCSAESLYALSPIFDSVTRLELQGGFQGRQLGGIEKFRYLSYVNLQQCDLTGLRFEFVQQAGHQQALSLIGSRLDSDAIPEISRSIGIDELNLQQTNVDNADLAMLEKMSRLARLNLGYNSQITDDAVPHLAVLKLKYLEVGQTGVTAKGVWRLKKALPDTFISSDYSEAEIDAAGN